MKFQMKTFKSLNSGIHWIIIGISFIVLIAHIYCAITFLHYLGKLIALHSEIAIIPNSSLVSVILICYGFIMQVLVYRFLCDLFEIE